MPDNVGYTPGVGATVAADDVAGALVQRVKAVYGGDGVATDMDEKPSTAANQASSLTKLDTLVAGLAALLAELEAKPEIIGTDYAPRYGRHDAGGGAQGTDPDGNLTVRAQVLTDEGTFRANFANASLAVALGTVTLTNASTEVAWTITDLTDVHAGDYIKLDADGESAWVQIESVDSLTGGTLVEPYTGTGGTGAGSRALMKPTTGTGGTISVANGQATIAAGTTAAVTHRLKRLVDFAPLVVRQRLSVSQRIANQDILIGGREDAATPRWFARFRLNGTTATAAICETGRNPTGAPSANETESTTITLPNGLTTASLNDWRIEILSERVAFYVAGILVAEHSRVIPQQYDVMTVGVEVVNGTTPSSGTSVVIDYVTAKNHNKVEVGILSETERVIAAPPPGVSLPAVNVTANNTDFYVIDMANIAEVSLQVSSVGGGATIAWQASNDPAFAATVAPRAMPGAGGGHATTTTAVGHWVIPRVARYLRIRTTAYTSGTITCNLTTFATPGRAQSLDTTYNGTQTVTANIGTGSIAAGTNTIGQVRLAADAGQGASTTHRQALVANITTGAPTSVKGSAGTINSGRIANNSGTGVWVHFYNKASAPTLGTDTPVESIFVKAGDTFTIDAGAFGDRFTTGIAYAIVDNCAAVPAVGGTITIASTAAAICVSLFYT